MEIAIGHDLHCHIHERNGSGATVVFVHGWATTGAIWSSVLESWSGDERLLACDLRGCGWSSKPRTGYTLEAYASDVLALLAHLDTPVTLVGHSMGGAIAQWVASEAPSRVKKLILVSPVPASGVPMADEDIAFFRSLAGHKEGMRTIIGSMLAAEPAGGIDEAVEASATVAVEAYLEGLDAFRNASFADRLPAISASVHVMGGELEQPLSPEVLQAAVVSAFDEATFEAIPGVGHYPHLEAPALFTELLENAVRS